MKPVYLDYAATTPAAPEVVEAMCRHLGIEGVFANPASRSHLLGWQAEEAVELARRQVADLLGADPRDVIWTSGATEANNLALKGFAEAAGRPVHIVSSAYEHKAVLDCLKVLEARGHAVTLVRPGSDGCVQIDDVLAAVRPETALVSLMHVNNELGTINPVAELARILRSRGIVMHVDAAQSIGKLPVDVRLLDADLISVSAHKFYGPKGIGALFVRRSPALRLAAQIHGGGHERGFRSGTLPTHQIVGMGVAAALVAERYEADRMHLDTLSTRLLAGLSTVPGVECNARGNRVPGILNVAFEGIESETLMAGMPELALSSGSACNSATVEPSYVLTALGLSRARAHASLRISIGRPTTLEDIDRALEVIERSVARLRSA